MDLDYVQDLVRNIAAKNMIGAQDSFNAIMADKLSSALDDKRMTVAASVYGGSTSADAEDNSSENSSADAE